MYFSTLFLYNITINIEVKNAYNCTVLHSTFYTYTNFLKIKNSPPQENYTFIYKLLRDEEEKNTSNLWFFGPSKCIIIMS